MEKSSGWAPETWAPVLAPTGIQVLAGPLIPLWKTWGWIRQPPEPWEGRGRREANQIPTQISKRRRGDAEAGPAGCTAWRGPWQGPVGCTRGDATQERGRKGRNAAEQNTSPSLGLRGGGGADGTCPRRSPAASFQKADNLSPSNMGGDSRTKNCPLEKRFVVSKALAKNISLFDDPNSPLTWVSYQNSDEETEAQTGRGGAQQIHMLGD